MLNILGVYIYNHLPPGSGKGQLINHSVWLGWCRLPFASTNQITINIFLHILSLFDLQPLYQRSTRLWLWFYYRLEVTSCLSFRSLILPCWSCFLDLVLYKSKWIQSIYSPITHIHYTAGKRQAGLYHEWTDENEWKSMDLTSNCPDTVKLPPCHNYSLEVDVGGWVYLFFLFFSCFATFLKHQAELGLLWVLFLFYI